jgi:hypothetical protein
MMQITEAEVTVPLFCLRKAAPESPGQDVETRVSSSRTKFAVGMSFLWIQPGTRIRPVLNSKYLCYIVAAEAEGSSR